MLALPACLGLVQMDSKQQRSNLYGPRLERLRKTAAENGFDGVILVPGPNLRYYTGVNSLLLERPFIFFAPNDGQPHLVAPTLESGPYRRCPIPVMVHSWDDATGPSNAIEEAVHQIGMHGKWGLEGSAPFQYLSALLKASRPQIENAEPILQSLRARKEPGEIRLLHRAASILSKSFLKIPDLLKPSMTELELSRKVSEEITQNGAESVQDALVQSGAMAADGHHLPSSKRIMRKESIVVDISCTFSGYYADITRTFIIGRDSTFENLYQKVLDAEVEAIAASRPGVSVGSVDQAARSRLHADGLDQYFVHRIGHGLGLEVHEAPYLVPGGSEVLDASMAFTIEPGVYMQGKTGLRIEDDLVATENGRRVLTKSLPKEFGWWS
jgi:Xaa-Pro aminopeptidase